MPGRWLCQIVPGMAGHVPDMTGPRAEARPRVTSATSSVCGETEAGLCQPTPARVSPPSPHPPAVPRMCLGVPRGAVGGSGCRLAALTRSPCPGEPVLRASTAQPQPRHGHRGHREPSADLQHPSGTDGGSGHGHSPGHSPGLARCRCVYPRPVLEGATPQPPPHAGSPVSLILVFSRSCSPGTVRAGGFTPTSVPSCARGALPHLPRAVLLPRPPAHPGTGRAEPQAAGTGEDRGAAGGAGTWRDAGRGVLGGFGGLHGKGFLGSVLWGEAGCGGCRGGDLREVLGVGL